MNARRAIDSYWETALVILPLCIGSVASARQHGLEHFSFPNLSPTVSGEVTVIVEEWCAVLLLWLVLRRHACSIRELLGQRWGGVPDFLRDVGLAVAFTIVAVVVMGLATKLLHVTPGAGSVAPRAPLEAILWVPVSLTAGFCEELIFRGYLFSQFKTWTRNAAIALVLQGIAFGLAHGCNLGALGSRKELER